MYTAFFKLNEDPFRLNPDPKFLYLSKMHARAKTYLDFAVWNRDGFVVITGEIGSGKTTVLNRVLTVLNRDVNIAKIHQTQLDENQLLHSILYEFGLKTKETGKVNLINILNNYLISQNQKNQKVLLVIDEAQNLSAKGLEELRLLSGLETDSTKLINIILVGQPELRDMLDSSELEQLAQRIRLRFHLKPLPKEEIKDYILYRLKQAGSKNQELFEDEVFPYIYRYTGGIPRLINVLCDTALIVAYADNLSVVSVPVIKEAIKELQWVTYRRRKEKMRNELSEQNNRKSKNLYEESVDSTPLEVDLEKLN